jgi:Mg/Co/Ni transporter MgtE
MTKELSIGTVVGLIIFLILLAIVIFFTYSAKVDITSSLENLIGGIMKNLGG